MRAVLVAALVALAGCGGGGSGSGDSNRSDTRQQPSNYTPGVHVSGHVNVGVVRRF